MKISLQTRLLASLVLLVFVTLAIMGKMLLVDSERRLEAFQLTQAKYQAQTLANGSLDALVSNDFEQLERLVSSALPSPVFAYAALVRPNGQVLTHSDIVFIGKKVTTVSTGLSITIREITYQSRPVREVVYPAIVGNKHIANSHIAYYLDAPDLVAHESLPWIIFSVILSIIILSIGSYFITRRVIHPIEHLTNIVSHMSFDELENKSSSEMDVRDKLDVYNDRNDEIGLLYQGFDNAISRLKNKNLELQESRDLLEHRVLERTAALAVAKAQAEQANIAKSAFLANMSHEIRTPLTAIIGFSEILQDEDVSKKEQIFSANMIIRAGKHLLELINDILDLSKIEADKVDIETASFNVFHMMAEVNSIMQNQAKSKGISFEIQYKFPFPETIESDIVRLKQIILNLCSNAIKFTESGAVKVEVSCNREKREIKFLVIDTGIGMTKEQTSKIFDAFVQADISTTRKYGGTGLGLHLSRRLALLLGGDIEVESEPGQGSKIGVFVQSGPLEDTKFLTKSPTDLIKSSVNKKQSVNKLNGHILLVEDNRANQIFISRFVEISGAKITIVENGKLAIEKAMSQSFDLILMDIQMPVMGGLEAMRILRDKGYKGPIVALTANAMSNDVTACFEAGCDKFLAKPIERSDFYQILGEYLDSNTENDSSAKPIESTLLDEDLGLMDMGEKFIRQMPSLIDAIETAAKEQDFENLRLKIHDLKSTGGGYGYPILAEIADHINTELTEENYESVLSLVELLQEHSRLILDGYDISKKSVDLPKKSAS